MEDRDKQRVATYSMALLFIQRLACLRISEGKDQGKVYWEKCAQNVYAAFLVSDSCFGFLIWLLKELFQMMSSEMCNIDV